jgi:hypothetical protein
MLCQTNLVLALAASASAHMIINYPKPFGRATLNSSPLLAPADFPCKQRNGVYAIDTMNQWNAGETQVVSFNGTAVHGGGSCQFSITTDPEPTEQSQWKVIQSVIGNCPSNVSGNLPDPTFDERAFSRDPLMNQSAATFPVTMPSNIPNGRYTFAWTWLNKLGDREFYMNCAPIQVGSGTGSASAASAAEALSALPDMFVANLPNTECKTTHGQDFVYPNPGENVSKGNIGVVFGADLTPKNPGGPECVAMSKLGAGSGQIGSPSAGTPSTPSQGTPPKSSIAPTQPQASKNPVAVPVPDKNAPQPSKVPSNPDGGVFAPGASPTPASGSAPQQSSSAPEPTPPAAKPTPPAAKPLPPTTPQTPSNNNTAPVNGECTPCTNDGAVVCIGSKQFGLCNRGCAVAQDLAAGMVCSDGVVVAATKRHVHFPRSHLHRRFSAARFL